ncbi:hypothetical protein [Thermocrinis jamiesonii]|uniref:hypothetical protein n=1 Tax=Thermocrinis jamiesonii TaxID=1302351 RepID=UPI000495C542|nr:hypothetical protein [Thermocrinis jamiesonii]
MELFFFPDIYAGRELIDYYIVTFELSDISSVELMELEEKHYIRRILDWDHFKKSAKHVVLYELGDEIDRFSDIEEALKVAYKLAYNEAIRRGAKDILPATGVGNPPIDVIKKVFPTEFYLEEFPENLESYLDHLVRNLHTKERSGGY